jgi:hypothetical protein
MPRGGKRPGAGAPKGNLNALKHGERSKQFARLGEIIAKSPMARALLLRYADRFDAEERKADELAATVIEGILRRGLARGRDRQIYLLPEPTIEERSIRQNSSTSPVPERADAISAENTPSDNQSADSNGAIQSENPEGNDND